MDGDVRAAAADRIWRSTTRNSAAGAEMIPKTTRLRSVPDATKFYTGRARNLHSQELPKVGRYLCGPSGASRGVLLSRRTQF